jgi:Domain of unknown function (DUF1843)
MMPNVQPNEYNLAGENVHVVYSTIGPTLEYVGSLASSVPGAQTLTFSGAEINTQALEIGTLVTVGIRHTIDTGGTSFSLLIPVIELANDLQTQAFSTIGIWTRAAGPDSFPSTGVRESYSTGALTGTASCRHLPPIVPLYAAPIHQSIAAGDLAQMKRLAAQASALVDPSAGVVAAIADLKSAIAKAGG